ncbi:DPOD1 [Hepatospora eriocheir]|uniref:DNA-directed DNA polymerase n=1 Tax=Hepatospora eriocheir TaxID=1081669 RepID=A0A1X0QK02_9MICR|nr:DPOD1 [Hepatospora eriocheir]
MINFYESSLKRVFEISENVANYITKKFFDYGEDRKEIKEGEKAINDGSKFSIVLEFEKVYFPYILMNKKRYAGLIYNNPEKPNKIDTKGIEAVRRDNCHLLKKIIDECLNRIFYKRDITSAVEYVKEKVTDLYNDRVDLFDLIISKTYTKTNYAVKSAHVELVEKLKKRGVDVKIGDRIPYVIVSGGKNDKIYDKSEDPLYALENNIPIDIEYYIEHQLSNPIHRLFDPIMDNVSSLFKGVHVAGTKKSKVISGPLKGFLVVKDQCVGCGTPGTILCSGCRRDFPKYLYKIYNEYNEKTKLFNMCWRECQRCMKSTMTEVICVNDGCPIFYKRIKVKKQIEELQGKVNKISSIEW